VVGVPSTPDLSPELAAIDQSLGGLLTKFRQSGDLTGKPLELVPVLTPTGIRAKRLLLVGLGPVDKQTRATIHDAFAAAFRSITGRKFERVAALLQLTDTVDHFVGVLGTLISAIQGSFGPGLRKSEPARFAPVEIMLVGE